MSIDGQFLAYASVEEGTRYCRFHMKKRLWDNSTVDTRMAALATATRDIDNLKLLGQRKLPDQPLRFPREGQAGVPDAVKAACVEIALCYLAGRDPDKEYTQLSMVRRQYGPMIDVKDTLRPEPHLAAGILSLVAWNLLLPYMRLPGSVTLVRSS